MILFIFIKIFIIYYTQFKSTIKGKNNIIITKQKDYYDEDINSDDYDLNEDDLEFLQ